MNFTQRLDARLIDDQDIDNSVDSLLELASSPTRFDSIEDFKSHLVEGSLLNVTKLASDCLAIPSGRYVVWLTNSGKTVLVPTFKPTEVYDSPPMEHEISTTRLTGVWNRLEKILIEDLPTHQDLPSHLQLRQSQNSDKQISNTSVEKIKKLQTDGWSAENKIRELANLMVECKVNPIYVITEQLISIPVAEKTLNEFLNNAVNNPSSKVDNNKLLSTAINAIQTLVRSYSRQLGNRAANIDGKRVPLDEWLGNIAKNLSKIKAKMPEVKPETR